MTTKKGPVVLAALAASLAASLTFAAKDDKAWFSPPAGFDAPPAPEDNPLTREKAELGKRLYFDKRLSRDGSVSCATCHNPAQGWTDQAPVSTGIKGQKGGRSAPTVLNAAYSEVQFWDGRAATLEEQAKGPIANPVEMGFTHEEAVSRISGIKGYRAFFKAAFGDETVDIDRIAKAIASFERTVVTGNAPFDRFEAGDTTALTASQQRGMALFYGKANCSVCHTGKSFTDSDFHNIGVGMDKKDFDKGRLALSKQERDTGAFKTPTLRNLSSTAPYMHDGSEKTLEEVVDYYDRGGTSNRWLSTDIHTLSLTKGERADLVSFLKALDGDPVAIAPPDLPE
jgi:cytochrome c peroxidase